MSTLSFARHLSAHIEPLRQQQSPKKLWSLGLIAILGMMTAAFVLCCLATGFGRLRSKPTAAATYGLNQCDAVPCFRGLIPGKTTWSTATQMIDAASSTSSGHSTIVLGQSADHARLDTISIEVPSETTIIVADVLNLYGVPCQTYLYSRALMTWNTISLSYTGLRVQTDIVDERLNLDTPIRHLFYSASAGPVSAGQCGGSFSISSSAQVILSGWRP